MRVSLAIADGFTDAGLAIALDVLRAANSTCRRLGRRAPFAISVCSHDGRPVRTASGLRLGGLRPFSVAARADALLVPGTWLETPEEAVSWLRGRPYARAVALVEKANRRGALVLGSCSGTFVLGGAGLLDGKPATTTWFLSPVFARAFPLVRLDATRALVALPRVVSAGAVFAMADLAIHLVRTQAGPAVARVVTRHLLLDEHPAQAPYMALTQLAADDPLLAKAERWMRLHLEQGFDLAALARGVGASQRTLARRVAASLSSTPGRWLRRVRAEEALRLLETTPLPIERVAERAGFGSALSLRRALREVTKATPSEARRRVRGNPVTAKRPGDDASKPKRDMARRSITITARRPGGG